MGALPIANNIAGNISKRMPGNIDPQDLRQNACLGLMHAASRYDAAKGIPFGAYARRRIRGEVLDGLRRDDHISRHARAKARAEGADADAGPVPLVYPDALVGDVLAPDEYAVENQCEELIQEALEFLPARERLVMLAYYFSGKFMREIGADLGVAELRVSQIHARGLELLRAHFENIGVTSLTEVRL
jgi:RNA polymerase sigma factor for flagellar operon FliA